MITYQNGPMNFLGFSICHTRRVMVDIIIFSVQYAGRAIQSYLGSTSMRMAARAPTMKTAMKDMISGSPKIWTEVVETVARPRVVEVVEVVEVKKAGHHAIPSEGLTIPYLV